MSTSILYYFVDTNLFIQCQPLEQIDWSPWNTFEEVRLIVSSPMLREIDYRKNKGNDRSGKRARSTSAMFRKVLKEEHKLIHARNPRVVLTIELQHTYEQNLQDRLNYQERDDQLIGILYKFTQHHQDRDARLLTHDTTPLFVARSLDLTADIIPDDWLLQPENTEVEKELTFLKTENARLKKAEPSFSIRCMDQSNSEIECYRTSYTRFEPLSESKIDELMQRLRSRFPLLTDFGPRDPPKHRIASQTSTDRLLGRKRVFTPASNEEIENYRDRYYPQWLEKCEHILRSHHHTLQQESLVLEFLFVSENIGTRSAKDSLITIEARGNFQIRPRPDSHNEEQHDEDDKLYNNQTKVLPRPPTAPCGQWRTHNSLRALGQMYDPSRTFGALADPLRGFSRAGYDPLGDVGQRIPIIGPPPLFDHLSHDSNAFYYKPSRPKAPQELYCLECEQWRHGDGEKLFHCEVHIPAEQDNVEGALICRIQADNLSNPISKTIPLRIKISHISAYDNACAMVDRLLNIPNT